MCSNTNPVKIIGRKFFSNNVFVLQCENNGVNYYLNKEFESLKYVTDYLELCEFT